MPRPTTTSASGTDHSGSPVTSVTMGDTNV